MKEYEEVTAHIVINIISYTLFYMLRDLLQQHVHLMKYNCKCFTYLASQAVGVKSSLCLVLKMKFLVRISRMDGG